MDSPFDPNVPDCSNGDFFCKVCLTAMNSEQMWASHICGRRHIKNMQKYPNGLPNRYDEEQYNGTENYESYGSIDDCYYNQDYYDRKPLTYEPAVRPSVVIDYGHSKTLDEILPVPEKVHSPGTEQCSKVAVQGGKSVNVDDILNELKSKVLKNDSESKKDDFFAKINQRELARDLASELSKSRIYKNQLLDVVTNKSLRPGEKSKRKQDDDDDDDVKVIYDDKKRSNRRSSPDLIDRIHKYNDDKLFKGSKVKSDRGSSSTKFEVKLKKVDPDKLTPDILDDLLSSRLKPKTDLSSKTTAKSIEKEIPKIKVNLDDPEVIAEKLQNLPNKTFFKIVFNKLKKIEIEDSEELKILLEIISEAQEVVSKKLPPHILSAVKARMSENSSERKENNTVNANHTVTSIAAQSPSTVMTNSIPTTSFETQNRVSQNCNIPLVSPHIQNTASIPNYPAITSILQFQNPAPRLVSSSVLGGITSTLLSSTQTPPARFPGAPPNSVAYPSVYQQQNYQANNSATHYQMMHPMYQSRQSVPTTNAYTVPSTSSSSTTATSNLQPPTQPSSSQIQPNSPSACSLDATLKHLRKLADEYKAKKQYNEEKSKKESNEESREKYRKESNTDFKYRKESYNSRKDYR